MEGSWDAVEQCGLDTESFFYGHEGFREIIRHGCDRRGQSRASVIVTTEVKSFLTRDERDIDERGDL
jgi:hypothetical protein